ncbi:tRNA (N(6)-L-threonylcarbamoyladenosine(37)-C(2))-methylthiotransferase MtaB [Anderseniella sp. Alg231-50]|uniref:tRNA (N(6)-L-threonylcarbamoyladenosine(37)-C(2))- methylthiotransferase MtaB n=1 Tax=Anderseniella sp. Alg231-50 TaxID=1922226 RepID=UPI000D54C585
MNKPVDIVNFGCRLNAYEAEVMRSHTDAAGLDNAVVINTCAVTAEAQRQARQAIRRARRDRPGARIIVTGCAAQVDGPAFAAMDEVDLVVGNEEKLQADTWRKSAMDFGLAGETPVRVNDIMEVRETALHMLDGFGERTRAFVQVQTGCDHRCTFCIIPFGRGNSRSVGAGEVVTQIRTLVASGCPEVVLSGVDITSYGKDLPGQPSLGNLVRRILKTVPELQRLRISSIDSVEADEDLLIAIEEEERLMPHLHLSLQAGDDMILKRMKRRHLRDDAIRFCDDVRRRRPDVVFGADIIAGFPTETDAMFENSIRLVEDCGLTFLHVFPYSVRPGTPAAKMPQVNGADIKARAKALRSAGEKRLSGFVTSQVGQTRDVLFETESRGRTPHYLNVDIAGRSMKPGEIASVRLLQTAGHDLAGELVV